MPSCETEKIFLSFLLAKIPFSTREDRQSTEGRVWGPCNAFYSARGKGGDGRNQQPKKKPQTSSKNNRSGLTLSVITIPCKEEVDRKFAPSSKRHSSGGKKGRGEKLIKKSEGKEEKRSGVGTWSNPLLEACDRANFVVTPKTQVSVRGRRREERAGGGGYVRQRESIRLKRTATLKLPRGKNERRGNHFLEIRRYENRRTEQPLTATSAVPDT